MRCDAESVVCHTDSSTDTDGDDTPSVVSTHVPWTSSCSATTSSMSSDDEVLVAVSACMSSSCGSAQPGGPASRRVGAVLRRAISAARRNPGADSDGEDGAVPLIITPCSASGAVSANSGGGCSETRQNQDKLCDKSYRRLHGIRVHFDSSRPEVREFHVDGDPRSWNTRKRKREKARDDIEPDPLIDKGAHIAQATALSWWCGHAALWVIVWTRQGDASGARVHSSGIRSIRSRVLSSSCYPP